jgi:hypothetical protein
MYHAVEVIIGCIHCCASGLEWPVDAWEVGTDDCGRDIKGCVRHLPVSSNVIYGLFGDVVCEMALPWLTATKPHVEHGDTLTPLDEGERQKKKLLRSSGADTLPANAVP